MPVWDALLMSGMHSSPQMGTPRSRPVGWRWRLTDIRLLLAFGVIILYGRLLASRLSGRGPSSEAAEAPCKENEQLEVFKKQLESCRRETRDRQLHMDELSLLLTDAKERRRGSSDSSLPEWRRPFGAECKARDKDLERLLNYTAGDVCPDDWPLVQDLLLKFNCFHLPKRGCFAPTPANFTEPLPLPQALWTTPPDGSIRWNNYACKSFECLEQQSNGGCRDCFHLEASRTSRALAKEEEQGTPPEQLNVDEVIALKKGSLRLGVDVNGGTGTFAAQMAKHNITIITTSINEGAPFMETMALRGVVPLFVPPLQRLPFFDNALDIVHCTESGQALDPGQFELMVYDWDRVLRPGAILWLQSFQTTSNLMPQYISHLNALKYKRHAWLLEENLHIFGTLVSRLTAVLEKPIGKPNKKKKESAGVAPR